MLWLCCGWEIDQCEKMERNRETLTTGPKSFLFGSSRIVEIST